MAKLTRRQILAGSAAAAMATRAPLSAHAQKRGGTLRFVPISDLKILDPIWTTAYITRDHGYMIYDTLFALDENLRVQPQMVDKYTVSRDNMKYNFTLRDGLKFHDGQPVTAEDCVVSIQRWGKKDPLGKLLMAATAKVHAVDRKSFGLDLAEPFGQVVEALGKPSSNVPFIMPARLAATSENEQVKDAIGSGPFRFVKGEWQPGHQVIYERNPDYVPRNENPSGAAGGKRVYLDRVIYRYLPEPATAAAAIEAGEIDYWTLPPLDFVVRLEKNSNLTVFVADPRGQQGWIRPNHLHPPFNNKKARQALLHAVNQETVLQAAIGHPKYYRTCPALFVCGGTYEANVGAPAKPDLERARQLLKESGYDGGPVVLLDPTDIPTSHGATLVTREILTSLGIKVDLQALDWSTVVARRAKKEPPKEGGWNVFLTAWTSADLSTPALNAGISGACDKAWFGWPCNEQLEKLRTEWVRATDPAKRKQIAEQIQALAYEEVLYVPWGQYLQPSLLRKNVTGRLQFPADILWNVAMDA
jgi:peptide/nickel transport system substrate-binding protein